MLHVATILPTHAMKRKQCRQCRRHLPSTCFHDVNDERCLACGKRNNKKREQTASNGVVTEIELPTNTNDRAIDQFVQRNAAQIQSVVEEYRQGHKYVLNTF